MHCATFQFCHFFYTEIRFNWTVHLIQKKKTTKIQRPTQSLNWRQKNNVCSFIIMIIAILTRITTLFIIIIFYCVWYFIFFWCTLYTMDMEAHCGVSHISVHSMYLRETTTKKTKKSKKREIEIIWNKKNYRLVVSSNINVNGSEQWVRRECRNGAMQYEQYFFFEYSTLFHWMVILYCHQTTNTNNTRIELLNVALPNYNETIIIIRTKLWNFADLILYNRSSTLRWFNHLKW